MKISKRQLRRIIRETLSERSPIEYGNHTGYVDDYEYEVWKIYFPKRGSENEQDWIDWFDSMKPSLVNRFDPVFEIMYISYHDPSTKRRPHSAKIKVPERNRHRFVPPPRDASGQGKLKLVERE